MVNNMIKKFYFISFCMFFSKTFAENEKPNVLFIMVDDLRVELGAYGGPHVKSPNIDKLADSGTRFANAYVSVRYVGPHVQAFSLGCGPCQIDSLDTTHGTKRMLQSNNFV